MNEDLKPLPWQVDLWLQVTSLATSGQLGHALLLAGPRGVGKRQFARALTAFVLCEQKSGYACGNCRSCQQFIAGTHPNAISLQRGVDDKGKEKRDISVEQVREFSEKLQLTSHYGQAKVAVIDPAEALNNSGVNALLKTIEEPNGKAHMLLVTERPMALAPTLRSRCQRLRFAVPAEKDAMEWLRGRGISDTKALQQAHGAPLHALELKESGLLETYTEWARGMQDLALQKRDPLQAAGMVGKDQAAAFLGWLQHWLTQQLRSKLGGGDAFAASLPEPAIEQLLKEALEGQRRLQSNLNPQMLIEALMILWWRLARGARAA